MTAHQIRDDEWQYILDLRELSTLERALIVTGAHAMVEAHEKTSDPLPTGVIQFRPRAA